LFAGTDSGLFVTRDRGESWSEISGGPVGADSDVAAVAVSPAFGEDGVVLVSIFGEGLYRSTDGGRTFEATAPELIDADRVIADYENPTSSPIQFSSTFATDRTIYAYAGTDLLRSTDGGDTWEVLELPSVDEVAESLGVEVDALSLEHAHGVASGEGDPEAVPGGRWTIDTPVGTLSARRMAAAAAVAGVAALVAWWLTGRFSWRRGPRWLITLAAFVLAGVVALALLAA
jgi:hypothetical protein